jgi:membrane protein YqaA with SNARE-associated domain
MAFYLAIFTAAKLIRTLRRMGGVGLLLLGVLSSVLPLPGSVELVTILLSARHRDVWWYYALMATAGTVIGGYIPFHLGWTGGTQMLARRLSQKQAETWTRRLYAWGFGAIVFSGLLPPPLPSTPLLLAAGAVHYPRQRFIAALTLGRGLRFALLALLASIYRRKAVRLMNRAVIPMIVIGVLATVGYALWLWYQGWSHRRAEAARIAGAASLEQAGSSPQG